MGFRGFVPNLRQVTLASVAALFAAVLFLGIFNRDPVRAESGDGITSGLVGQWKLNDGSGISAADSSVSANPLTLNNMNTVNAWSTDTPYSDNDNTNSLLLNDADTNDFAVSDSPLPASVLGANSRSLCGWVKLSSTAGTQIAFNFGGQFEGQKFGIFSDGTNWRFWGYDLADITTTATVDTGWHHHCITYDGTTVNYLFDGTNVGSATRSLNTTAGANLVVGQRDTSDLTEPLNGQVDDIRVYDRALTMSEVREIADLPAPGDVAGDLTIWLKANYGLEQSGSAVSADGSTIDRWANSASAVTGFQESESADDATIVENALNFNPGVDIDGNDRLFVEGGVNADTYLDADANGAYIVFARNSDVGGANVIFQYRNGNTDVNEQFNLEDYPLSFGAPTNAGSVNSTTTPVDDEFMIVSVQDLNDAGGDLNQLFVNGALEASAANAGDIALGTAALSIGARIVNDEHSDITLAEFIVYENSQSAVAKQQIESYLALKYGITLDQTVATDYISSDGVTAVWSAANNTGYDNDIFGIGQDDDSALDQRISQSVNDTDSLILATTQDFTSPNNDGGRMSLGDGNFLTAGHNAGTKDTYTGSFNGGTNNMADRIWRFDETGTVGNVYVAVPLGQIANMPSGGAPAVVVSSDTTFDNADTVVGLTYDFTNGLYYAEINPADGDYLSLAVSEITVAQPAYYRTTSGGVGGATNGVITFPSYPDLIADTNGVFTAFTQEWAIDDSFFVDGAYVYRTDNGISNITRYPSIADLAANQNGINFALSQTWATNDEFFASGNEFYRTASSGTGTPGLTVYPSFADLVANTNGVSSGVFTVEFAYSDQFFHDGQYFLRTNTGGGSHTSVARYASLADLVSDTRVDNQSFGPWSTNDDIFALGITADFTLSETALTIAENAGTDTFDVVLDAQPQSDVVFDISSDDTGEATVAPATLTFTGANWNTPQTVTVTGVDDSVFTTDTATITVSVNDGSSDDTFDQLQDETVAVTLTNDDSPGETVSGVVYYDEDGAGDKDVGETTRLQDVAITLYNDVNNDNAVDGGDTVAQSATDSAATTGAYSFSNVADGEYVIQIDHTDSALNNDTNNGSITYGATTTKEIAITVSGSAVTDQDFGFDQPEVTLAGNNATINEDGTAPGSTTLTATISPTTGFSTTVNLATGGGATDNSDYEDAADNGAVNNKDITIAANAATGALTIDALQDVAVEGAESFTVDINSVTNAIESGSQQVSTSITDDDSAAFSFTETAGDTIVAENAGTDTFTVVLDTQPVSDVVIAVTSDATTEATVSPATLTFTNANWDSAQTVTVTGVNDNIDRDDATAITLAIDDINSDDAFDPLANQSVGVTATDDDSAGVTITESAASTDVTEGGVTDTYTVVLDTEPTGDVVVTLDPASGVSLGAGNDTAINLSFDNTDWNSAQTVTVTANDDGVVESSPHTASITSTVNTTLTTDTAYDAVTGIASVTANITDNDPAGFTIVETGGSTDVDEGSVDDMFTVVLNNEPASDVVIAVASGDTGAATVGVSSLTFTNANWNSAQTVMVSPQNDTDVADETVIITASVVDASSDDLFDALANQTVTANVTDNDSADFSVSTNAVTVAENAGTNSFTVVLDAEPTSDVVFGVTSDATGEATVSPATLTFTASGGGTPWNTPQTVTVTGVGDSLLGDDSANVTVSVTDASSDDEWDPLGDETIVVTVTDDDSPNIIATATDATSDENGATATIEFTLTTVPSADVTIPVSSSDTTEGTVAVSNVVITPANFSNGSANAVTVTGVEDVLFDGNVAYTLVTGDPTSSDVNYDALTAASVADPALTNTDDEVDADGDGVPADQEAIDGTSDADDTDYIDTDGDGVPDYVETNVDGTSPSDGADNLDTDGDGHPDYVEDNNGGNASDDTAGPVDSDGDGVPDLIEDNQGTNPNDSDSHIDTDGDGHPDYVETIDGGDAADPTDGPTDTDGDGVPDAVEIIEGTNPNDGTDYTDTDGDGHPDYIETIGGGDAGDDSVGPVDSDGDGVPDVIEVIEGTDLTNPADGTDSDGDGTPDYLEIIGGGNPIDKNSSPTDTDGDGIPDVQEVIDGTDPTDPIDADHDHDGTPNLLDTDDDGDGVDDAIENLAPGGDGNGDGVQDSIQQEVASAMNPETGVTTTIESMAAGCSVISGFTVVSESDLTSEDESFEYPVGLNDFQIQCANPGDSTSVTLYYDQEYDTSDWQYKKYNDNGSVYSDISDLATFGTATVDGSTVTTVTYTVTDGGITDTDGVENGVIDDPAGPAVIVTAAEGELSDTGASIVLTVVIGSLLVVIAVLTVQSRQKTSKA